jgi:hypothetical protein
MAKKKAARTKTLSPGQPIRIKPGITAPEFPDVSCGGWTGVIMERIGKKTDPQYVVEWDEATLNIMPASYKDQCEARNLMYSYSCFSSSDLEVLEG